MPSVEGRGLLPYIKRTMDTSSRKTALVVLFNHQYDRNIPVIREIYSRRFSGLLQLMPYYRGGRSGRMFCIRQFIPVL